MWRPMAYARVEVSESWSTRDPQPIRTDVAKSEKWQCRVHDYLEETRRGDHDLEVECTKEVPRIFASKS